MLLLEFSHLKVSQTDDLHSALLPAAHQLRVKLLHQHNGLDGFPFAPNTVQNGLRLLCHVADYGWDGAWRQNDGKGQRWMYWTGRWLGSRRGSVYLYRWCSQWTLYRGCHTAEPPLGSRCNRPTPIWSTGGETAINMKVRVNKSNKAQFFLY